MGEENTPNAVKSALVLAGHGFFLAACGLYGAWSHGFKKQVMHSAYAGVGSAGALIVCAALAVSESRIMYMIGVHVALLLQVLFVGVFALQAYKSYGVPEKADRLPLFVVMCLGSAMCFALMIAVKPKKKKKEAP